MMAASLVLAVLIAYGWLPEQGWSGATSINLCRDAIEVNALSPALFAEAFAAPLARARRGTLAIIGSWPAIAAARPTTPLGRRRV